MILAVGSSRAPVAMNSYRPLPVSLTSRTRSGLADVWGRSHVGRVCQRLCPEKRLVYVFCCQNIMPPPVISPPRRGHLCKFACVSVSGVVWVVEFGVRVGRAPDWVGTLAHSPRRAPLPFSTAAAAASAGRGHDEEAAGITARRPAKVFSRVRHLLAKPFPYARPSPTCSSSAGSSSSRRRRCARGGAADPRRAGRAGARRRAPRRRRRTRNGRSWRLPAPIYPLRPDLPVPAADRERDDVKETR
ncbi:hypothetical protein VPH35_028481 [Triticum aestivum]